MLISLPTALSNRMDNGVEMAGVPGWRLPGWLSNRGPNCGTVRIMPLRRVVAAGWQSAWTRSWWSVARCVGRDGKVQMGRGCLSGKAFAQLEWDAVRPVVITVAPGAFSAPSPSGRDLEIVRLEAPASAPSRVKVIGEVAPAPDAMGVTEADVLVAGGAGVGGAEGFHQLVELARRLGGTVAASRVAVDKGWVQSNRQVGLTGKTVSPRLYLAVGISVRRYTSRVSARWKGCGHQPGPTSTDLPGRRPGRGRRPPRGDPCTARASHRC